MKDNCTNCEKWSEQKLQNGCNCEDGYEVLDKFKTNCDSDICYDDGCNSGDEGYKRIASDILIDRKKKEIVELNNLIIVKEKEIKEIVEDDLWIHGIWDSKIVPFGEFVVIKHLEKIGDTPINMPSPKREIIEKGVFMKNSYMKKSGEINRSGHSVIFMPTEKQSKYNYITDMACGVVWCKYENYIKTVDNDG